MTVNVTLTVDQAQGLITLLQNEPGNTPLGQLAYHIYMQGYNPSGQGNTAKVPELDIATRDWIDKHAFALHEAGWRRP